MAAIAARGTTIRERSEPATHRSHAVDAGGPAQEP